MFILARYNPNYISLPGELYYYTSECNSSAESLLEIQVKFIHALNSSAFQSYCTGKSACRAEFVDVTCGDVTGRRKRSIEARVKRQAEQAYIINVEFILPFERKDGQSDTDIFTNAENVLYGIADVLAEEVNNGLFEIDGLTLSRDSFAYDNVQYSCPKGTLTKSAASCGKMAIFYNFGILT